LEEGSVEQPDAIIRRISNACEEACPGRQIGRMVPDCQDKPDRGDMNTP